MRRKIIIIVLVMLAIAIPVTFVTIRHNEAEAARAEEELGYMRRKAGFAVVAMYFEPFVQTYDYTETLLVHSEEEAGALNIPSYVRVLWPTDHTLAILMGINMNVIRNEIDLSEFGLTYPITIEDVVYDWELVYDLYSMGFSNNDIRRIWDYFQTHLQIIREEAAREEEHDNED